VEIFGVFWNKSETTQRKFVILLPTTKTTTTKMAVNPRQPKIDALLTAIKVGDETVIMSSCKGLQLADFYFIVTQVCLKPKPVVLDLEEREDGDTDKNVHSGNNKAVTEHTVEAAEAAKAEELVKARKKAEKKVLEAAQIEAKRKKKLHCKVFVKFGSSEKNDGGCKHGKNCHYKHPKLCRLALRGRCVVKKCKDHHLTATKPPARSNTTTTTTSSNNNNNNNKLRPSSNQSHHQASWGPFLGKTSLSPPGISSMEELAKIVTQMVIQSLGSMNSNNNNMQQGQPHMWGQRCHH
jgi:hypothetical protein